MRTLEELVDKDAAGAVWVRALIARGARPAQWLECELATGEKTLLALQEETRTPLGAMAYGAGGLIVDHGWLRILGGGCKALPRDLVSWNRLGEPGGRVAGALLIADDAVGGFFALNRGGLPGNPGEVCWLSPQSLEWENLSVGYAGFLEWALAGDLAGFYAPWRFPGWEDVVRTLSFMESWTFEPYAAVVGAPFAERKRHAHPVDRVWSQHSDALPRLLRARAT